MSDVDVKDVYVGSGSGRILRFGFDDENGALSLKDEVSAGGCPSFLALHKTLPILVAVDENEDALSAFRIQDDGSLKFLNRVPSGGAGPAYVSISQSGELAFVANYGGGTIALFAIAPNGQLRHALQVEQAGQNPHSILTDQLSKHVYVPTLGSDVIVQYALDLVSPKLVNAEPHHVATPPGAGPRHLAFLPSGSHAYVVHEHKSLVSTYRVNESGSLEELQTISTLPDSFTGENTGADIHVAPSGRFVYVSNRGHNSIAIFAVGDDRTLTCIGHESTRGEVPRNFALCGETRLLVGNLRSDSVAAFSVDPLRGTLRHLSTTENIPSPFWVGTRPS